MNDQPSKKQNAKASERAADALADAPSPKPQDKTDLDKSRQASPESDIEPQVLQAAEPVEPTPTGVSASVLAVGGGIEVKGLQANQVSVLQKQHAKGLIEVQRKASELKVDIHALDQTLESLTTQARTANDAGVAITATHTQNTTLGQTEIIVGNTQRAATGKLAPFWGGFDENQVRTAITVVGALALGAILMALFT